MQIYPRLMHLLPLFLPCLAVVSTLCFTSVQAASDDSTKSAGNRNLVVAPVSPGQGRRIALVIGNGNYQFPDNLPKLDNPTNDAQDIAAALRGFGFEVIERKNQTQEAMNQSIAEFGSKIGGSEAALFYFAGHGIQVKNQNYLMPINARVESEAVVPYQGVNVNQILDEMDNGKSSANIVMLDACRNNPISGKFRSGHSRGLASPGSVPKGTVIVYATDPGNVASDGSGRNGLFTAGLLTAFKGKELSLDDVLTVASAEVERASEQKQTPYVNGPKTLQKNFYFRITVDPGRGEIEKTFWNSIEHSSDPADFEAYLRKYPNGSYRALAENQIRRLRAGQQAAPASAAVPEKPVVFAPVPPAASADAETQMWQEVKASGAREYFEAYLQQYAKGKYAKLAKVELKKLDDQDKAARAREEAERKQAAAREAEQRRQSVALAAAEQARAEQSAWDRAKTGDSLASYLGYLEAYPQGKFAGLARAAQQKVQREAAERGKQEAARRQREQAEAAVREESQQWQRAQNASDSATVQGYLDRYPNGRYVNEAQLKLAAIKKEEAEMRPGKAFKDCADCPEMVMIPAGSFEMGGTGSDEKPVHNVRIARSFAIGKTEVTQGQWRAVMGSNPSHFSNCGDDCPMEKVSWNDAQEYVQKLSQKTGKSYRLPSEAEWEYACRAGGQHTFCGSDNLDGVAWYRDNSGSKTHAVAGKQANAWGLYDMTGNVWEWTEDCWNVNYNGAPGDGSAWTSGNCSVRVLRGGSWYYYPQSLRSAYRFGSASGSRDFSNGFRLARTPF